MFDYWDISPPLDIGLPIWPTSRGWEREVVRDVRAGDAVTESYLRLDVHTGSHVDAPLHHLAGGASVDALPLEAFWGSTLVVDATGVERITADLVQRRVPPQTARVLFRTANSERKLLRQGIFMEDFVALDVSAARRLAQQPDLLLVGVDYLSVQPYCGDDDVHRLLLAAGVCLLEGIDLGDVTAGTYELSALPLHLPGAEAAPLRAVLRRGAAPRREL